MREISLTGINLLYVEDEAMIRDELVEILEDEVGQLFIAGDGQEALDLFNKHSIDIIVTDIRMPRMDGLTLSRSILDLNPRVPIIIASAFNDSQYLLEAIKLGIHYYLMKPIDLQELFHVLHEASASILNKRQLEQSERLLRQYKEAVDKNTIVSKTDKQGIITYVNEAFSVISGYAKDELIGKPHNIVRHPEMGDELYRDLWQTILSKKEWHGVIKNRKKDGSFYVVDSTIIPVLDSGGEIVEFISIRHDVTQEEIQKQKLEEKLYSSAQTLEEKIQFIYEYEKALKHSTLFCRTSMDGRITMASDAFVALLGIEEHAIYGCSYLSLVDQEYIKKLDEEVRRAVSERQSWQGLVKHRDKKNNILYLETTFIPILDMEGNIHEVLCFYIDTTQQVFLNQEIVATQKEVISTMGAIGETRSKETGDHVKRVAEYSKLLALKHGLGMKEAEEIKMASPMHDIGKVGIPDNILNKPGRLTDKEFEIMKTHAQLGYEMLKNSKQSLLQTAAIISREHHEKWDGTGYPRGLKEDEIHIYGRITAIADVFDALGHDRVYKEAWPIEDILALFEEGKGKHFDPGLIDLFFEHLDEFLQIKEQFDGAKE